MRRASNRNVMAWTFMGNTRMHQVLREKGNKLSHVGIFTFEVSADGTISETGTAVSTILPYVKKWPHIKWLLTIMNHGTASIFTALRENTDDAQDTFISEIVRIIDKYPWCSGIDIDLERGGELANRAKANALFSRIYSTVKAKGASLHVNICLPGMTSVGGSVGGENWCVYADLDAYCDTAAIMSYGMSWAGSAPGPVSPRSWLEGIYSYAANAMNPDKIMMGLPGYGWRWQIYDTTENLGTTYRGTSLTYYAAKYWMEGLYNHTGDAPPQPFIPFFSYWDWTDMVPWGLLHVYDFMEGWDTSRETAEPTKHETYSGRKYLTTYLKQQKVSFGAISVDRNGVPDSYSGNAVIGEGYASVLDEEAVLKYTFEVPTAGIYDVAVEIVYPRWDKNSMMEKARAGEIDLIITKSISRFARNTVTVLKFARELKELGVGIFFEEQNINTLSGDGEMMLAVLASFAQEESRSMSENNKWSIRKKFERGEVMITTSRFLGYDKNEYGDLIVNRKEAEIVSLTFDLYLLNVGSSRIGELLDYLGVKTVTGTTWESGTINGMLCNEKYKGDFHLQKYYTPENKRNHTRKNNGEVQSYYISENHEPIVSPEVWEKVQEVREQRKRDRNIGQDSTMKFQNRYPLSGMLICPYCGKTLRRRQVYKKKIQWLCSTYIEKGVKACKGIRIDDAELQGLNIAEQTVIEEVVKNGKKHYCYTSKADFDCGIRNSTVSAEIKDGSVLPSVNRPRRTVIKL